jgi:hypothetical protein
MLNYAEFIKTLADEEKEVPVDLEKTEEESVEDEPLTDEPENEKVEETSPEEEKNKEEDNSDPLVDDTEEEEDESLNTKIKAVNEDAGYLFGVPNGQE